MKIKSKLSRLNNYFNTHPYLSLLLVFEMAFILFFYLHSALTFADPDSFYHAKLAVLMSEQGIIKDFPWLQFTILKDYYIDHHFLYHLALVPFVKFLPPLAGVKLATIVFSSALIMTFYWLLKKLDVRGAFFYAAVLMVSNPFIFRVNLAKAQALALIFLLLAMYLIFLRKYWWIFFFSFAYVWLYGGWPLILIMALIYIFSGIPFLFKKSRFRKRIYLDLKDLRIKLINDSKLLASISLGLISGILFSPYFPKNLFFYWQQIFQIAVVNYRGTIGVGGEWYPYNFFELIGNASIAFFIFLVASTFFVLAIKKQNSRSIFLFLMSVFFLALTLRSRRNVEYLIPVMLAFSAVSLDIFSRVVNIKSFWGEFKGFLFEQKLFSLAIILIAGLVPYIVIRDVSSVKSSYDSGFPFQQFERSMDWMAANSRPGEIIFQSDWDEFPMLFFNNSKNYYIVGLDPTFMFNYDRDLYWKWERVTTGRERANMHQIIKEDFGASYVFVSLDRHEAFDKLISSNTSFREVYSDFEVKIYRVL